MSCCSSESRRSNLRATRLGLTRFASMESLDKAEGRMIMPTGKVKFFNNQRGFGFIEQDGGGPDVFVHISAVERAGLSGLNEGQQVTFDIATERGKTSAANLKVK